MCGPMRKLVIVACLLLSLGHLDKFAKAQECDSEGVCDKHERCSLWKEEGECLLNKAYMDRTCPVSCKGEREHYKRTLTECEDMHPRCELWASTGECEENQADMNYYCPRACGKCDEQAEYDTSCVDTNDNCAFWAEHGECENNEKYMHQFCPKSCRVCKKIEAVKVPKVDPAVLAILDKSESFGSRQRAEGQAQQVTLEMVEKTARYMETEARRLLSDEIYSNCQNRHELCAFWSTIGECENNKAYMQTNCAPSCQSCEMIDIHVRCPKIDQKPALHPGELNKMFERIIRIAPGNRTITEEDKTQLEQFQEPEWTVHILSRPSEEPATEVSAVLDKSLPPWAVYFENFLTDEECDALIQLGYEFEYKRSEDVGPLKFDGTHTSIQNHGRTSENAWCSEKCRAREVPTRIHDRVEKLLQIPANNSEDFQMLRYEVGQFYNTHHDFIPHQVDRQCGPRILTFFMYLSDVEAGGGTNFPNLDITVMPKKGRALLWPSVYDHDPMKKDSRFMHQALPVEAGVKYGTNGWIHMYDYVESQKRGCN